MLPSEILATLESDDTWQNNEKFRIRQIVDMLIKYHVKLCLALDQVGESFKNKKGNLK